MSISSSAAEVAAEVAKILKTDPGINTRKAQDIADVLKKGSTQFAARPNTDAAMKGLIKWGLPAAALGTSVGIGTMAAGAGVKAGLGVSGEDPEEGQKSLSGWLIFLGVAAVVIVVFLPKIKEFLK
jgi:hypothetical protein